MLKRPLFIAHPDLPPQDSGELLPSSYAIFPVKELLCWKLDLYHQNSDIFPSQGGVQVRGEPVGGGVPMHLLSLVVEVVGWECRNLDE